MVTKIHAIISYIDFEHNKGKDNVLTDRPPRLKTLGLYEANDCDEPWNEYGKCIFDSETDRVCDVNIS